MQVPPRPRHSHAEVSTCRLRNVILAIMHEVGIQMISENSDWLMASEGKDFKPKSGASLEGFADQVRKK